MDIRRTSSGGDSDVRERELMVDWFARQGPKIYDVWRKAGALDA